MSYEEWVIGHARMSSKPHKKVKLEDKMSFFQQLSTLVAAGTPLLQGLRICADQNQSVKMRKALSEIVAQVSSGASLYSAAGKFPAIFEHHWVEVIKVGEVTGKMAIVLLELNKQIRESRETRRKVSGSLMYPIILVVVAIVCVTLMLWLVVPTFAKMFQDMGAELPASTQFVVDMSGAVVKYGPYVAVGLIAIVFAFKAYMKTESGRLYVGGFMMVLPMVGDLCVQMAMYKFSSGIALLLKSGVPMLETMNTLTGVFHTNPIYRNALTIAQAKVSSGRPLAAALDETGLFPTMMSNMVRIGEESGQLSSVMEQIAPYYKEKMETLVLKVTKLLEPVIIMGMGSTIAALMLAIYMPMFEMA